MGLQTPARLTSKAYPSPDLISLYLLEDISTFSYLSLLPPPLTSWDYWAHASNLSTMSRLQDYSLAFQILSSSSSPSVFPCEAEPTRDLHCEHDSKDSQQVIMDAAMKLANSTPKELSSGGGSLCLTP
ncbi:unnamed protein product [Echinostoma caproni]|uniref:Uncharacterized protein n=1 Tax=Echinostoma caproni TaxID=27848 RepID=A0A183B602_9TREM|nr:unnamed protein product [Echinostoma caproni]